MTTITQHTRSTINAMHDNDEWCGFGYLGERRHNFHKPELLEQADNLLLEFANDNAWTEAELFIFCNSTSGRYYGDVAFGSGDNYPADELRNDVKRWDMIRKVEVN